MPTDSAERDRREKFRSSLENHEFHSQFSNLRKAGVSESKRAGLQDMDSFYDGQSVQTNPTVATQRKPPETDLGGLYFPERRVFFPCSLESGKACGNVERTKFPQNNAESITRSSNYTPHETGQLVKNFKNFSWSRRKGEVICVWGCLTGLLLIICVTQVQHDKERLSCLAPWLITLSLSLFLLSSLIFDFNQSQVLCNRLSPLVFLMAFLACIVPKLLSPETPHLATKLGESAEADEPVSLDVFLISSLPLLLSCAPVISWQNLSALSAAAVSSFLSLLVHINSTANPHRRQLIRFSVYVAITMLVSSCAISYFGHRAEDELMGIVIEWEETLKNASLNREEVLQAFEKNKHECSIKIKEMRNFISYIFHEIRVPFNAVVLGIGHLLGSDLSEDQCEVLKMMDASSTSMIRILNDVLDMGKIEAGKLQLERQPFNMCELVRSLIWAFKDTFESKGLDFSLCIDQSTQDFLCDQDLIGDKHRVRQVLANYLSNAAKFTPRGGQVKLRVVCNGISFSKFSATDGDLKIRSRIESVEDNTPSEWSTSFPGEQVKEIPTRKSMNTASLTISVEDTGIGISKEDQERLFEPYTQIGAGSAQGGGGTGLGLSFSKRIVELAAGNIGVFSEEGRGSIFYVTLPFELASTSIQGKRIDALSHQINSRLENGQQPEECVDSHNQSATPGPNPKVLVVEDNQMNRKILRRLLSSFNVDCKDVEDGKQAIELYRAGEVFDMILIDKEMPVMDGHEATRELRAMGIKVPIIGLTGNALESDRNQFLAAGVDDFFTKPLSRHQLVKLLEAHGLIPCS